MNNGPAVPVFYDFSEEGKGELRSSKAFFEGKYTNRTDKGHFFEYRRISEMVFFCGYCGKPLKIKGGGEGNKRDLYFSHRPGEGENCPYNIGNKHPSHEQINRIKYHGQRVGARHEEIKRFISNALNGMDGVEAKEEKVMRSEIEDYESIWKRPDITAKFDTQAIGNDKPLKIVFEIQLSTTFFEVIASREKFYKDNQVYIIWVFDDSFSPEEESQKFAQMDVLASNNHNAYVLDEEAKRKTKETGKLHFTCYYNYYEIVNRKVGFSEMKKSLISLDQLTYDEKNYKAFFVDVKKQREECERQLKQHLEDQRILRQLESEHNSYEEEELRRLEIERSLENLIHNYEIDKLGNILDDNPWEITELYNVLRKMLFSEQMSSEDSRSFIWLISNSKRFNIFPNQIVTNIEDYIELLETKDKWLIRDLTHWLFLSYSSWIQDYRDHDSLKTIWSKIRSDSLDNNTRCNYATWFMYQSVVNSKSYWDEGTLNLLKKSWKIFLNVFSVFCNTVIHNELKDIPSTLFNINNNHPEYVYLFVRICKYLRRDYSTKRYFSVVSVLEATSMKKEQDHSIDTLAHCIFPKVFN